MNPETENIKPGWARPNSALRHADIGRTTLYDWIKRGLIESHVIGKKVRLINLQSLDDYIRGAEVRAKNGGGGE